MPTIIADLKRTIFRLDTPPLYGGVTLAEVVTDVDAGAALYSLDDDGHCIWEIVLHAAYWRRTAVQGFRGPAPLRLCVPGWVSRLPRLVHGIIRDCLHLIRTLRCASRLNAGARTEVVGVRRIFRVI